MVKDFSDLEVWKKAHQLSLEIYKMSKAFPKDEIYGITSQLRRASSSIGANIAEGFGRYHFKDKSRFYYQARGSTTEVQNFLLLACDLHYIDSAQQASFNSICTTILKLTNGLIRSTSRNKD